MRSGGPPGFGGKDTHRDPEPSSGELYDDLDDKDTVLSSQSALDFDAAPREVTDADDEQTVLGVGASVVIEERAITPAPVRRVTPPPTAQKQTTKPRAAVTKTPPPTQVSPPSRASARVIAQPEPRRTPVKSSRPPPISETDPAPLFRPDLKLARTTSGYIATDPSNGDALLINDFEFSLIRMLNGKRPIAEILKSSRSLGIPVNLESLHRFILRLEEKGFLAAVDAPASDANPFPSRGQWEAGVRGLFQSGIKLLRSGKPSEAAGYFEMLLEQDPDNVEARELLAMARDAVSNPDAPVGGSVDPSMPGMLVTIPPPFGPETMQRAAVLQPPARVSQPRISQPPPHVEPLAIDPSYRPPPVYATQPVATRPPYPQTSSTRRWLGVIAAGLACVGTGTLVYMLMRSHTAEPTTPPTPPPQVASNAPPTPPPKPVPPKPVPPKPDPPIAVVAPPDAAAAAPTPPVDAPREEPPPPPAVEPTSIKAPIAGEISRAYLVRAKDVTKGEALFEITRVTSNPDRARVLNARIAELEKITSKDYGDFVPASVIDATNELTRVRKELAGLNRVEHVTVTASLAGHAEPKLARGAAVKAGGVLAQITPQQQ